MGRIGAIGFSIGTKGYIGTGRDTLSYQSPGFWEWDQGTDIWMQKADFRDTTKFYAVGFSIRNKGYVASGHCSANAEHDFWEYDPAADAWVQKADFPGNAIERAVGFTIGNKGYVGVSYEGMDF